VEPELRPTSRPETLGLSHIPVLLDKAVSLLNLRPGLTYVDATVGGGSHLKKIVELTRGQGTYLVLDRDPIAIERLKSKLKNTDTKLVNCDFGQLKEVLQGCGINTVTGGILADLGVSSMQLDDPARGFSFLRDGPLDMRMDTSQKLTAYELVNKLPEAKLAEIILKYGEERHGRIIAKHMVRERPLNSTCQVADLIASVLKGRSSRPTSQRRLKKSITIHPATRTFQALRIAVNHELDSLEALLEQSRCLLAPGGRLVLITFHSLEDRLVKQFFRRMASACICPPRQPICNCHKKPEFLIITRKPIVAGQDEVLANVRSRSAKLRAGEKLA